MEIEQEILGFTSNDEPVILYSLTNGAGTVVKLLNVGAAITSFKVKNSEAKDVDIILGYRTFDEYIKDTASLGKVIGRYAGRISEGKFTLNDKPYRLSVNSMRSTLDGGRDSFQTKIWGARVDDDVVVFSYQSPENEEGFPGELGVEVSYTLTEDNELIMTFFGKTTEDTVVNLTNHTMFNLNGEGSGDIYEHKLKLNASNYLPINKNRVPTGDLNPVSGAMDFRSYKSIGKDIRSDESSIEMIGGYDHCFAVDNWSAGELKEIAQLSSDKSGITLSVSSTLPGVCIDTANDIYGCGLNKIGIEHDNHHGVAIRCAFFPDSPNQPSFPTTVLRSDEIYDEIITYKIITA